MPAAAASCSCTLHLIITCTAVIALSHAIIVHRCVYIIQGVDSFMSGLNDSVPLAEAGGLDLQKGLSDFTLYDAVVNDDHMDDGISLISAVL
eukprot:COSAG06_NODE_1106_length_10684_cov_5.383656_5_plen_92_part_00